MILSPINFISQAGTGGAVNWVSYDDGIANAKKIGKPIYIEFSNYACGICLQENDTYLDPEVLKNLDNFVCININPDNDIELANQYDVRMSPTIFFLMPNGTQINKVAGYLPPPKLVENMTEAFEYYEFNYVAVFDDTGPSTDNNIDKESSDDNDTVLPMILVIAATAFLIVLMIVFVIIVRKYR
jgi:thiol-disulfide isomerase/thioredoxin